MFPKGPVTAAATQAEKPPVTAQKDTTVYMVDNTDPQVDAVNDSYWRTQRVRVCACAVVLTTLILVAGTLGAIAIVLSHKGVATTDPYTSFNNDREPLLSNEVPLPKLPETTIRIKIDDGGLLPPREPTTPDLIDIDDVTEDITKPLPTITLPTIRIKMGGGGLLPAREPTTPDLVGVGDVTDDITKPLPTISLSSSDSDDSQSSSYRSYNQGRNYLSSSFPYDGYYARGQKGTPPWEQSNWIGPSERARDETDAEVSGDGQEGSAEPDPAMTVESSAPGNADSDRSSSTRWEPWGSLPSDGIFTHSNDYSSDTYDYV